MAFILRGAVNAISAPYQYYKDLNPSTLTGAIDVIVIQRPAPDGSTELVCSPFHVRFGKWQVLRPFEKKVNVFVNGNPIPFNMKIGEAGEAFFVFETDDDIPEDLITSPILQPTIPDEQEEPVDNIRFGAKEEPQEPESPIPQDPVVEPEYLDLDGQVPEDVKSTPRPENYVPHAIRRSSSRQTISQHTVNVLPSPPPSRTHSPVRSRTPVMDEQDRRVDAALQAIKHQSHVPEVEYHHDVTLDMEGYKQGYHGKERSDDTIRSSNPSSVPFPSSKPNFAFVQSAVHSPFTPSPSDSRSPSPAGGPSKLAPPSHFQRATSEPPLGLDAPPTDAVTKPLMGLQVPVAQEYSWEWGAFPTPSPMKTTFGKGGRIERVESVNNSAMKEFWTPSDDEERVGRSGFPRLAPSDSTKEGERLTPMPIPASARSRSVPPLLEASEDLQSSSRGYKEYEDLKHQWQEEHLRRGSAPSIEETLEGIVSTEGTLNASAQDGDMFVLCLQEHKISFQLSLLPVDDDSVALFDSRLISVQRFLDDENVLGDPRLVLRIRGRDYVTRENFPPLFDALARWRRSTLDQRAGGDALRAVSPPPPDIEVSDMADSEARMLHARTRSEPPTPAQAKQAAEEEKNEERKTTPQPPQKSSLSWMPWWRRARTQDLSSTRVLDKSKDISSASLPLVAPTTEKVVKDHADTVPSTPTQRPVDAQVTPTKAQPQTPQKKVRYAKTLRLTSDQLKSLNLRPGANSITFSLSATGAIAATARIFVWDSTDLVVISDIDGTITKSDGLGHVFAMIGRDWTHVGVAKLYTDIVKNGYKIMYLTSRAIGQADSTRDYLKGIRQNDYQLPEGPVIMSPDRLMASLHREVIMRKPEVFKMACLRDIQRLFGESARNPFYAGFGNRITDALSYRSVNVPSARIFTIDSAGEVKMELLELAGYKSSYIHMTDLVDQMFPPIHRKWTPEFTDFNYWKAPVQEYPLPDFSPPSPTLSARSDTSGTLARLRNFSLGGSRANSVYIDGPVGTGANGSGTNIADAESADGYRSSHLRQMSSFERLSSTLGGFMTGYSSGGEQRYTRSTSPDSSYTSDDEEGNGRPRTRPRARSMTSMPGSLDDMQFGMDDDDEEAVFEPLGDDAEHGDDDLPEEASFGADDEAMFEEMQDVPYL